MTEARPGFYHKPVQGISISLIVLGSLCICLSTLALVVSLTAECTFEEDNYDTGRYVDGKYVEPTPSTFVSHCNYYFVFLSPGIWSGLMVITSGIIGVIAARRKTACFIVSLMVTSLVATLMTASSVGIYIAANFQYHYRQISPYPVSLYVINSCGGLLSLASTVLLLVKFSLTCRAVCCNGKLGLPSITDRYNYQPLYQPHMAFQGNVMQPNMMMQPAPEPIYLMQGQKIIGIMPQQMQQPCGTTSIIAQPASASAAGVAEQQA